MKCEVMASQNPQEKERANDRESSRADDKKWTREQRCNRKGLG